jgi:hypothetical protein
MFDASSSNMCMIRGLYYAKMHLAKENIEIQRIFTLHKIFSIFSQKN